MIPFIIGLALLSAPHAAAIDNETCRDRMNERLSEGPWKGI